MKYLASVGTAFLLTVQPGMAWAQIYESRDEQGNPVFSDEPVDGASSAIELREPNIADAPPPVPKAPDTRPAATDGPEADRATDSPAYRDPDEQAWEERERRQEAFDRAKASSTPSEVLDAEPPREVMDAQPRREIMDAEPPREVKGAETPREVRDAQPRREVGDF